MIEEITTDVYDVTIAEQHGGRYRVFLFDGEISTLVDAGFEDTIDVVAERLAELGISPERLVIAHGDPDHVGGLAGLAERYELETWAPGGTDVKDGYTHGNRCSHGDEIDPVVAVHTPGHPPTIMHSSIMMVASRRRCAVRGRLSRTAGGLFRPPTRVLLGRFERGRWESRATARRRVRHRASLSRFERRVGREREDRSFRRLHRQTGLSLPGHERSPLPVRTHRRGGLYCNPDGGTVMVTFCILGSVNVERLFRPERIAVIGASKTEGKVGYETMANAVKFNGRTHPVNPSASGFVFGERFVESVTDIDSVVDLALLAVPAPVVPNVLSECGTADVGAAVIYAGGFAEASEQGELRQTELIEIASRHDIAILGPNTSGFVIPNTNLCASFAGGVERIPPGDVAVIAQSGGVAHTLGFQALREGYGLSAMVGLGNRANVGFETVVPYFDADEETEAIVLHVEGTEHGRALLEACREATTPVVAYKVGQSDVGDFAESHTGALTGDHALYTAGFAQYGVSTVDSTLGLFDAGIALAKSPPPAGGRVGVVTAQAGPGIIIADHVRRAGGTLPALGEETKERIGALLPGITYAENPVDTGRPMPEFGDIVAAVAEDDAIDSILVYELFEEALGYPVETLAGLANRVEKPVLFATDGPAAAMADDLEALREADVPVFTTPERAARVAALLARHASSIGNEDREVSASV